MLRNLLLLNQLQRSNVPLCPTEALTRSQSPLWTALTALLPLSEARVFTFVLDELRRDGKRLRGFVQARQPPVRPEAYIQYLGPRLDADEDAQAVWNRLLNHIVAVAGEHSLQRVFACATDGGKEIEVLVGAGFSTYTREEVFRLAPDTHPQATAQKGVRPEQSTDVWAINQLYRAIVPHLVQRAESFSEGNSSKWACSPMVWSQGEGFVLEDSAGIAGYGYLMSGRIGHWLNVAIHLRAYAQAGKLLDYGLALLNYYPPYPVYCAVREYQGGLRAPLGDRGFERFSTQCCLVKHTTMRIKESARGLVPTLEKRMEAPTTSASRTERQ
jgi:hypothetical protein